MLGARVGKRTTLRYKREGALKRLFSRVVLPLVPIVTLAMTTDARAQAAGYAVSPFDPSSPGSDWYATESLDLRGGLRPQVGLLVPGIEGLEVGIQDRQGGGGGTRRVLDPRP